MGSSNIDSITTGQQNVTVGTSVGFNITTSNTVLIGHNESCNKFRVKRNSCIESSRALRQDNMNRIWLLNHTTGGYNMASVKIRCMTQMWFNIVRFQHNIFIGLSGGGGI